MPDHKLNPKPCEGFTIVGRQRGPKRMPCPYKRVILTRYARRCKSCAAKQRQYDGTNPVLLARIRSPNHQTWCSRRGGDAASSHDKSVLT